jgi:hypothetical protein
LECIQSFVLDLRVNVLLQGRGFDMAVIDGEQWEGIRDIAAQCERGSRPRTARTAAALINVVAAAMLEYGRWPRDAAQNFHSCLMKIRTALPEVYRAAEAFATSVERHGVADREAICRVIDECARVSFRAAGDDFDPERDVVEEPHREWMYDKHPDFLPGLPVSRKLAIWRAMAKRGIGPRVRCRILPIGRSDLVITVADASGRQPAPARLTLHVPAAEVGAGALQRSIRPRERPERASPIGVPEIPAWSVHAGPPPMAEPQPSLAVLAWDSAGVFLDQQFPRGARSYMPGIGRWLSRVGFEDDDDEEQPYAYAENNPVVRTNPAGNAPVLYPSPTPAVSPPYPGNPTWWGPGDQSRWLCNCYAYAMNYSGGMVPPGLYSGFKYRDCPPKNGKNIASCTNLVANAVRDGLQKISDVAPCPSGWHKVVLFASDSDCDFHWYRENPDGSWWSKQPEQNAVECTTNPSEDARRQGYPVFCGTLCGPNTFVPPKPPKGRKR